MRSGAGAWVALPVFCILAVSIVAVSSAQERTEDTAEPRDLDFPTESFGPVSFVMDTGVFYSSEGSPLVEVYIQAPYDQLPFVREAGGFVSRVEIVAVFQNVSGRQVGGDSWDREIWVEEYDETIDPWTTYRAQAIFTLPPGEYSLRVTCGGVDSDLKGEAHRLLGVPRSPERGLALSDVRLGVCNSEDDTTSVSPTHPKPSSQPEGPFVPDAGRTFGVETGVVCAVAEVYSFDFASADTLPASLVVLDEERKVVWRDDVDFEMAGPVTELTFEVPIDSLAWGVYSLALGVGTEDHESSVTRFFEVDESRVDVRMDLERLLDLMSIIATEEELQTLAELPSSERKAFLDEIWRSRDPDVTTPRNEYKIRFFKRLKEAKLKFKELGVEGWQTDRGRVYIRNGSPDRVETRPGVAGSMSPYATVEIWYYDARNARYIFEDFGGTGSFTLVDVAEG